MSHNHNHSHSHHHEHSSENLKVAFFINLGFTIFEIIGGLYINSIAIISDAVHDLGDSLSLGTAWYLDKKSKQKASKAFSFGYTRFSLLGALINSLILIIGGIYVISEAVGRLLSPEPTNAKGMLLFAIVGVVVNGYAAWKLSGGKSLNERVVSWHLIEDVLGWAAILVAAIALLFWDIPFLDPALSLFITAYILWNVVQRLKETLFIFLQGVPKDISVQEIENKILAVEYVASIHHTHIWSLDGERHVFSTHVKLQEMEKHEALLTVKKAIKNILKSYPFEYYTIETELSDENCGLL